MSALERRTNSWQVKLLSNASIKNPSENVLMLACHIHSAHSPHNLEIPSPCKYSVSKFCGTLSTGLATCSPLCSPVAARLLPQASQALLHRSPSEVSTPHPTSSPPPQGGQRIPFPSTSLRRNASHRPRSH